MTHSHSRALGAALGALALVLGACSSPDDVVVTQGCPNDPGREASTGCSAYRSDWEPEWKESEAVLPPLPDSENLVPIAVSGGSPGFEYEVDRATVKRGKDDVMRYTILVRSGTGAVNIFREGMRCLTGEVRTYAYATGDGSGFRRLSDEWGPLAARGARGYQDYLYESIMCDRNGYAWPEERVVEALAAQYTAGGVRIERFCGNLQDCRPTGSRF